MVHEWVSKENVNEYETSPLALAVLMLEKCPTTIRHDLKLIIQHLIFLGASLHRGRWMGTTILDELMDPVGCPFDSTSVGTEWICILQESGVNVLEYLRIERRLHYDHAMSLPIIRPSWFNNYYLRHLVICEEPPSISWDYYVDPKGKGFEVIQEFRHFGDGDKLDLRANDKRWPFIYTLWPWHTKQKELGARDQHIDARVQLEEDRFEWRWQKKVRKLTRAQGILYRTPKMPGAWVD
jgi:hypothetical protein